jgi:hypothetical protein
MKNEMIIDMLMLLGQVELQSISDIPTKTRFFMRNMKELYSERFIIFQA